MSRQDGYEPDDLEDDEDTDLRQSLEDSWEEDVDKQNGITDEDYLEEGYQAGEEGEGEGEEYQDQEYQPIDPPARWTKEEKEEFAALDPRVQHILANRNKGLEAHYTKQFTQIAQERERYKGIENELASRREHWSRNGMSDTDAIRSIMSYWDLAQADPVRFLGTFAQERGIDLASAFGPTPEELSQLVSAYTGQAPQQVGNPMVERELQQMRAQQQQLQQAIYEQQQYFQQRQQAEVSEITESAQETLNWFANATDDNGQPLYPFFEDVRGDMAVLMRNQRASTLEEAYGIATRMNDHVWTQMQESEEIARRREDDQRRMDEAARARRAGASVSSSSGPAAAYSSGDGDDDGLSVRDLLMRQFQQASVGNRV